VSALYPIVFDDDELAFREEATEAVVPLVGGSSRQVFQGRGGAVRELYKDLGRRGWLNMCWPKDCGGQQRPLSYEFLLWDVLAEARAGRPDIGAGLIARVIISHGTGSQRERFLPGLAAGTLACALGYSEPHAGSDLTHLRTRATLDGDSYIVRGQKIWTSDAHHADRLWLLCRTDGADEGHRGLTLLFLDLRSSGVTIRPIPTMDGHRLNEVFLDDAIATVEDRIGEEGQAWAIIRESLAVERHTQVLPGRLRRDLQDLRAALDSAGLSGRADVELRFQALSDRATSVEGASLATVNELMAGAAAISEAARAKLLASELCQDIPRAALELLGTAGVVDESDMAFLWRQSIMETIAGGTVEIMLSLLAREDLGLGSRS
jgi:3-oxocholest-4-en-26-oyl-CoA dehydrogenase alpha subunit